MDWRIDWPLIRSLFAFGLPAGFQGIAMNIAGMFLLRFIGSLGHSAQAQAAYAVGYGELFSLVTWTSVGLMGAASTVVGQNMGAGLPDRSARGPVMASRIGIAVAVVVGTGFLVFPRALFAVFGLTDPVVLDIGCQLLRFLSVSGLFVTVALTYTGALQGGGRHAEPVRHLDHLPDRRAARPVRDARGGWTPDGLRHLDGDPPRAHHARLAQRPPLPAGEMEGDPRRVGPRRSDLRTAGEPVGRRTLAADFAQSVGRPGIAPARATRYTAVITDKSARGARPIPGPRESASSVHWRTPR